MDPNRHTLVLVIGLANQRETSLGEHASACGLVHRGMGDDQDDVGIVR